MTQNLVRIKTPKDTYTVDYPQAIAAAEQQMNIIWFAKELGVEKDENDIRTKCTEGERHGITTVLQLFTEYELRLGGDEFWGGKVQRMFPRPDIQRMANMFSCVEINIHAPFYDLINKTLNIATDEFYSSWKKDPILVDRMNFVNRYAESEDDLRSLAAFTFMEGAVLFSNFAFLKSFNVGGYNMIPHITSGIDASSKDENFHSLGAAWLFNQLKSELVAAKQLSPDEIEELNHDIRMIARQVYEHEVRINQLIFAKGGIRTVTQEEILHFIRNRIDVCLERLGVAPLFGDADGVVTEWFYNQLSTFKYADFFSNSQVQYVRNWNRANLRFTPRITEAA